MNAIENMQLAWDAKLYDQKHDFVFKYGEDLVNLLQPQLGESILDLGCGTGHLTKVIASAGAEVIGIDSSAEMIRQAKASFPDIDFQVQTATQFIADSPFDAVFSNAVLHWILEKEAVVDCIYSNLKRNGRFVMEMGGKGNVEGIVQALKKVLVRHGFSQQASLNHWYFPSLGEYSGLLEEKGFRVVSALHFNRDTILKSTNHGIKDWLRMFASHFLVSIGADTIDVILSETQNELRSTHFRNGSWIADYKRLRIVAIK